MRFCLLWLIPAFVLGAESVPVFPEKHRCTMDADQPLALAANGVPKIGRAHV